MDQSHSSGSIKSREFLDNLRNYQLPKNGSVPWNSELVMGNYNVTTTICSFMITDESP
jgi:hypothetical protein